MSYKGQAMDWEHSLSVYTLTFIMHSVSLQTSGHEGAKNKVPNKAKVWTTNVKKTFRMEA